MNYLDMDRAVAWIEVRWPRSKAWENWETLTEDFAAFTPGAVMEALNTIYRSGARYAPGPSELMKAVGPAQARRIEAGIDDVSRDCTGSHVWAAPLPADLERVESCVLCGEERSAPKCAHEHRNRFGSCVFCLDAGGPV